MPAKLWCGLVACGKRRNCVTTNIALHNGHKEYRVISRWQSVVASCCCTSLVTDDVVKWIFLCRCYGRKAFSALQDCSCTWRFVTLWHIQRHVDVYLAPCLSRSRAMSVAGPSFTMDVRYTESSAGCSQLSHHVAARRS